MICIASVVPHVLQRPVADNLRRADARLPAPAMQVRPPIHERVAICFMLPRRGGRRPSENPLASQAIGARGYVQVCRRGAAHLRGFDSARRSDGTSYASAFGVVNLVRCVTVLPSAEQPPEKNGLEEMAAIVPLKPALHVQPLLGLVPVESGGHAPPAWPAGAGAGAAGSAAGAAGTGVGA